MQMFSMIYLIYHQCLAKYVLITKARSCMYISVRDDKNSEFKLKKKIKFRLVYKLCTVLVIRKTLFMIHTYTCISKYDVFGSNHFWFVNAPGRLSEIFAIIFDFQIGFQFFLFF